MSEIKQTNNVRWYFSPVQQYLQTLRKKAEMTTNSTQKKLKCHKIYYLFLIPYPYIFPSFPSFLPSVSLHLSCSNQWAYGPEFWLPRSTSLPEPKHCAIARCKVCASMYITYISVSKSTPLTVTGPNGQLASSLFSDLIIFLGDPKTKKWLGVVSKNNEAQEKGIRNKKWVINFMTLKIKVFKRPCQ